MLLLSMQQYIIINFRCLDFLETKITLLCRKKYCSTRPIVVVTVTTPLKMMVTGHHCLSRKLHLCYLLIYRERLQLWLVEYSFYSDSWRRSCELFAWKEWTRATEAQPRAVVGVVRPLGGSSTEVSSVCSVCRRCATSANTSFLQAKFCACSAWNSCKCGAFFFMLSGLIS